MGRLQRATRELCLKCKYHGKSGNTLSCNYERIAGHSRLFENGKMAYSPELCNKFEEGPAKNDWDEFNPKTVRYDDYENYMFQKMEKKHRGQQNV